MFPHCFVYGEYLYYSRNSLGTEVNSSILTYFNLNIGVTAKGRFNGSCYFITQSKHSLSPLRRPSRRRYEYIQLLFPIKFIRTPRTLHSLIRKWLPTCALNLSIIFSFKAFILTSWKTSFSPMMLFFSLLYLAGFKLTLYLIKFYAHFIKVRYNFKPLRGLIILHCPFYRFDLF